MVGEETAEDVNVIFGLVVDESMGDNVRVTVVATGFQEAIRQNVRTPPAEVRLQKAVNAGMSPRGPARGGVVSGFDTLRGDDYDIPTFYRGKD
jgi:cell division protein FtsZ